MTELRATVARLEERISIEQRKKRDRDTVHGDHASDADDRDAYHHDWAAFRKQAAEDAYRELPALLATIKALLEDREEAVNQRTRECAEEVSQVYASPTATRRIQKRWSEAFDARAKESRDAG